MSYYGEEFHKETGEYTQLNGGINECKLVALGYNPNGGSGGAAQDVIDFIVNVGGLDIKHRMFEPTRGYSSTRKVKNPLTGVMEDLVITEEMNLVDQRKNQGHYLKALLYAMGVPNEEFTKMAKKASSFKDIAKGVSNLVPKDANTKVYECILGYDDNDYLKFPKSLWTTGKVFRLKDSNQKPLKVSAKIKMVKEGEQGNDKNDDTDW